MAKSIRDILANEDVVLPIIASWILAPLALGISFFYFGTIWGDPHIGDLHVANMVNGLKFGTVGVIVGAIFAISITVIAPKTFGAEKSEHSH